MAKLFIVGFPKDFQQIALVELFSIYGTVKNVTLITDKFTGEPKGYGFIIMDDPAGANRAILALNGKTIAGRKISVRFAEEKQNVTERPSPTNLTDQKGTLKNKRPRRI